MPRYHVHQGKLSAVSCGRSLPLMNKAPVEGLKASALYGRENRLYLEGSICGIQCLMLADTDLEKNETRIGGVEIPLFAVSVQHSKLCSVLARERAVIPSGSECLIQGISEFSGQFMYAMTVFPIQDSQKGFLVAATLFDLKREAIPVRVLNLDNKPKTVDKGAVIATCEPVVDIVLVLKNLSNHNISRQSWRILKDLMKSIEQQLEDYFKKFKDLFSTCDADVGCCNATQHRINTGDHPPIKQYPGLLPIAKKGESERIVKEIVVSGIMEESSGPWVLPIVFVRRKDGSTRFCVDYKKLNEITKKDSYPLPRIDENLDA
ncbi:hypothetical protein AVEN_61735-1 [Araneus ventricosus]|uniref:Retrovirus-related Pol polyprotein from transposon 297 n=1 Tax=Araneus ventricosus TaxID=182803 RepID=A0A4Y2S5E4_ARAVE|nr:hypothetical protein AVEN_262094-1 [Araneus ventricosus]GBN83444.1 hypothetical protein AVEN_61735-1 [Araneus ventricosus]